MQHWVEDMGVDVSKLGGVFHFPPPFLSSPSLPQKPTTGSVGALQAPHRSPGRSPVANTFCVF